MQIVLIGVSHHTASLDLRERLALTAHESEALLAALAANGSGAQALVVSTCNRTEVVAMPRADVGLDEAAALIRGALCSLRKTDEQALLGSLYRHDGPGAVRHLFRVASSLDSMMPGEPQILGQVKEAWRLSERAGAAGPELSSLMQRVFSVARRVRTDTRIARSPVSVAYAAADLAQQIFGSLSGHAVMLVGAGRMGELASRHLIAAGAHPFYVASRTFASAQRVAASVNGTPVPLDRFKETLQDVDILVCATSAQGFILERADGVRLMRQRRGRAIFVIDIAVPRDVAPELNELDNLYLYNIDDLQQVVEAGLESRRREAVLAEAIVEEEAAQFDSRRRARRADPTIVALRRRMHALGAAELRRYRGRLGPLSEKQEGTIHEMIESIINKILHRPTRQIKRGAGAEAEVTIESARRLFGLDEEDAGQEIEDAPEAREAGGAEPER